MSQPDFTGKTLLERMLDRLHTAMASGPAMSCRPHGSRKRIDLTELASLGDHSPDTVLAKLVAGQKIKMVCRHERPADFDPEEDLDEPPQVTAVPEMAPSPPDAGAHSPSSLPDPRSPPDDPGAPADAGIANDAEAAAAEARAAEARAAEARAAAEAAAEIAARREQMRAYRGAMRTLGRIRNISEDARVHLMDTGVHSVYLGFPILSFPPLDRGLGGGASRRVLAPVALVPVKLEFKPGLRTSVTLECSEDGAERVIPNPALLSWIKRLTGRTPEDLFADEDGEEPWREIGEILAFLGDALEADVPDDLTPPAALAPVPRADESAAKKIALLPSAVLGLFPLSNEAIIADVESLCAGEVEDLGPLQRFLSLQLDQDTSGDFAAAELAAAAVAHTTLAAADEHLIARADPCQSRAVELARREPVLVIHGPPGTGKSQTITNIIGDHLARGDRVLFVSDKRTALDVVKHRLDHLGLGELCAVVHDARRDRISLYREIRAQLDALADLEVPESLADLARCNADLDRTRNELAAFVEALAQSGLEGVGTLADLVGWRFQLKDERPPTSGVDELGELDHATLCTAAVDAREALERGLRARYQNNPWVDACGASLAELMQRPAADVRRELAQLAEAAARADATIDAGLHPLAPGDARAEGEARARLARDLERLAGDVDDRALDAWLRAGTATRRRAVEEMARAEDELTAFESNRLDAEFVMTLGTEIPAMGEIGRWILALDDYLAIARRWHAFLHFGVKKAAREVLKRFGVPLGAAAAERVKGFLQGLRTRALLWDLADRALLANELAGATGSRPALTSGDDDLRRLLSAARRTAETLTPLEGALFHPSVLQAIEGELADPVRRPALVAALVASRPRAAAVAALEEATERSRMFAISWLAELSRRLRHHDPVAADLAELSSREGEIADLLHARAAIARLPAQARPATLSLLAEGRDADSGWNALLACVLAGEIRRRLAARPELLDCDAARLESIQGRIAALTARKRELERDGVLAQWRSRQRELLLASTGTRLSSAGATMRRRTIMRGVRSQSLRGVIEQGAGGEAPDPLFDLRPVWLASPETVAAIFPRAPTFDTLIFDEASQVRLEEAMPLLLRARRVVIAGDPQQLPPTRFFEAAFVESAPELGETSEQELYEEVQGEVEDLLAAALNLETEHAYLDVHYRSRSPELIAFSNEHFYGSRLQARPAPPGEASPEAAIRLQHVDGVYHKSGNRNEARAVAELIDELLSGDDAPSIGVACFNLKQVDFIQDALNERAATDPDFATRLEIARDRTGDDSFEGLFVKNLEAVQGDERDHIIISTTYGRDGEGRFYRRFGPLSMAGGGRRLNVLVTRARQRVHLLTSIPAEAYRSDTDVAEGKSPSGAWYLFAYLRYAEQLARRRAQPLAGEEAGVEADTLPPQVIEESTTRPNMLARALADHLVERHGISSTLYWGDEGFQVDLTLAHPDRPGEATVGVLVDASRFEQVAPSAVWDGFRAGLLAASGWRIERVWSPHFARDPEAAVSQLVALHRSLGGDEIASQQDPAERA